jgi:uncharacterized protein (TIGR00725 family)
MIGVIGGGQCTPHTADIAEEVGRRIAERGGVLVCGGLGGVMQAAAIGAKLAGGQTIGILPGDQTDSANPYIDFPIATGIGYARNVIIVKTADVLIAIDGNFGTLSEVAYSLVFEKTVISLGSWEVDPKVIRAKDPQEAVDLAFRSLES